MFPNLTTISNSIVVINSEGVDIWDRSKKSRDNEGKVNETLHSDEKTENLVAPEGATKKVVRYFPPVSYSYCC